MSELATRIEHHLRHHGGWVSAADLQSLFGVDQREFRSTGGEPGLLSDFAISGNAGFRHIERCTPEEWDRFQSRIRRHGIGELVRIRRLRNRRRELTREIPPVTFEKHSDQALLLTL